MKKNNILIIGAGPVGLTAAVELHRRGFQPTIIDDEARPTTQSRALGVNARTLHILEPSGVTEQLLATGHRVHTALMKVNGREKMRMDLSHIPDRFNFLLVVPQTTTEAILVSTLQARGIDVQWGTRFDSCVHENEKLLCTLQGKEISADMLIGADGAHSAVRKSLGIDFPGETDEKEIGLADIAFNNWPYPFDHAVINIQDNHLLAFIPMGEGVGRFISTNTDVLGALPKTADVKEVIWESSFRISYRQVPTYQKGKVFLAGDAAHIHSPVGGRGMNLGIEDAATLAWLTGTGQTEKYNELRHPVGAHVLKFTHQASDALLHPTAFNRFFMQYIMPWATKFPPARKAMLKRLAGLETPAPAWLRS